MKLLNSIKLFSAQRRSWALLLLISIGFEACALYFQHVKGLAPCVMCVYERVAMFGIVFAALIGLLKPSLSVIRWLGLLVWGGSAYQGLMLSIQHVNFQLNPSPFDTCSLFTEFPAWLPLNDWLPSVFAASGECSDISWTFLSLTMPQWLVIVFAANLIILAGIIISQLAPNRARQQSY
ncbi:disulfide bond formation protein DsbB [Vibrio profundum]|uniref:disulfide bond formation protein DsbB n=1 Tax=Vibrio profundum TaxID=2910247 RepID=UPI003D12C791